MEMGRIEIESWPLNSGGVTIKYNGQVVADGLSVVSAFIFLAGLLAGNPCQVTMDMEEHGNFGSLTRINYERGREVVAAASLRAIETKKVALKSNTGLVARMVGRKSAAARRAARKRTKK